MAIELFLGRIRFCLVLFCFTYSWSFCTGRQNKQKLRYIRECGKITASKVVLATVKIIYILLCAGRSWRLPGDRTAGNKQDFGNKVPNTSLLPENKMSFNFVFREGAVLCL